jgi:CheY-specific phosphatase CheX
MLNLEVQAVEDENDDARPPLELNGVSGGVSFTGKMTGILYLNMSENLARVASDRILGEDPGRPTDEINDVVGELTNMVTGNLKSKMADRGYNCALSIPTVIRGLKITIDSVQPSVSLMNTFKVPETGDNLNICIFARLEE